MALPSWMLRTQLMGTQGRRLNFRPSNRNREEDLFESYLKQDSHECFRNILSKIFEQEIEEKALLSNLNTFVKLVRHYEKNSIEINFSRKDILCCLRISLLHESTIIRSAGLRCIRHTIKVESDVIYVNKILIPFLINRSLDLIQKNDVERIEAMKLMRKLLSLAPNIFDMSMARSLVSLANEGTEGKDRLLRISLATLSEIGLLNSSLFIESGGVAAITRNLIDCQIPKIAESLCGILLLLLDRPSTRKKAAVDLHSIAAPFCDFHYKHGWKDKPRRDERELRLNCSRLALLTILRSWPGVLHFCSPKDQGGFKAIVDVLYLNQLEVRKAVLDLLYDLLGLQQPEWSDELSVALSAIDPCEPQSSWRLKEGFVAAEGRAVLPHLAGTAPSPIEMHLALLLHSFLECGLLGALTEVIITSDTFISVRATILLAELLRLIQVLLPPGCCNLSPPLPALVDYATKSKPQAMAAITALQQLHKLMKKRPASYSLHLDYIIRNSSNKRSRLKQERSLRHKGFKSKLHQVKAVLKDGDDMVKDTGVLSTNDALAWNWNLIKMILKGERNPKLDLSDSSHKIFVKRLLDFFTPSHNKYSHMDLGTTPADSLDLTTSGIELVNYLVELKQPEFQCMVLDLFKDIKTQIQAITSSRSVHDCLFSPAHMVNTHCQSYFLLIGQFSRSEPGLWLLDTIDMFSMLKQLATTTLHDSYVKLIISSLDYSIPGPSRDILEAVLTCEVENSRLYATQFMLVLLRVKSPNFASWAIRLLVRQLDDESRKVSLSALSTLHEACELPDCLEALTDLNPNLSDLGEKGELLSIRMLSTEKGYKKVGKDKVLELITKWNTYMNFRYVKLVEGDISDSLTLHQRNEDGKYDRRVSGATGSRTNRKDIFLPPHLYGQLNEHSEGFQLLIATGSINSMIELIQKGNSNTEDEILKLKSAIWATSHMSTTSRGISVLNTLGFVENMIKLVTSNPVYAIRSTAFYALGLVATTPGGADELYLNGWLATRHNRHDRWPVIQEELIDAYFMSCFAASLGGRGNNTTLGSDNFESQDDDITLSEGDEKLIEYPTSPSTIPDVRKLKQWTLPANRTPPEVFHKRSMSESKTFDTSNGIEDHRYGPYEHVIGRQRNSSMTESTTSGVSSCDSLQNRQGGGANYLQTLSPIPSSTSLSVLKLPPQTKRHSHRVSSNSAGSEASTSSLTGSTSNELSVQNMLGYQTIRYIRRRDSLNFHRTERDDYLFRPPPQTSRKSLTESVYNAEPSTTVHFSSFQTQKFEPVYEPSRNYKPRDAVYMGICLPKTVADIYPPEVEINYVRPIIFDDERNLNAAMDSKLSEKEAKNSLRVWQHCKESCLHCSQLQLSPMVLDFGNDALKTDVLKISERLSNPVLSKLYKNQLVRLKQKDTKPFKDVCVYSEVCKLFSETSYSLVTRRILHELFLEVNYEKLLDIPQKILGMDPKQRATGGRKSTGDIVVSPTEFKTVDSLKLICSENKFPIRTRKNTN
ncbi:rapamycin-insensitive companion of mTOR [Sitophilus oryzae]|uniref:Rapamycin-insensitive companion of mTOR n=1 Tax=Sitophilus oryzae TaxID=7048 RepID=A0A6J2XFK4_SITOR|nr:rapamycin-insensitive companion of mTOR [Sitophilus oryzae]